MELRPGYKQTEVGLIPDEWRATNIGDVVSFSGGSQPPRSTFRFSPAKDYIRLVQIRDYKSDDFETYIPDSLARKRCTPDDIMIGRYGPPVFQILRGIDGAYNVALIKATPSDRIDRDYLFYVLKQEKLFQLIDAMSRRSSGQTGVEMPALKGYGLPLPSIAEQRDIACALSDMDALISGLDKLIAKKRDLKQGAMQQLLTGETRLPGFSGNWDVKRLGEILRFQVGFPFASDCFNQKGVGIRLVKNRDLKNDDQIFYYNGKFDACFLVQDGDVLIGMDGDFLPCRWSKGTSLLNQRVGRILPSANLNATFSYYQLIEPLKAIEYATSCTTVKHLSHGDLENIECGMPDLDEQAAIAAVLSDMDADLVALEARRDKTRALKQGMMQELLTGRIRLI